MKEDIELEEANEHLTKSLGIETIYLIRDGQILNYGFNKEELDFLKREQKKGADDFHITIEAGLSEEEQLQLAKDFIRDYDKLLATAIPIRNL